MAEGKLRDYVDQQNAHKSLLEWNLAMIAKAKPDGPDKIIDLGFGQAGLT